MLWDILFWLALAYLAFVAVVRFVIPALRTKKASASSAATGSRASWLLPIIALLVLAGSFYMKTEPRLVEKNWSEEEKQQLYAFSEALGWYDQARELSEVGDLTYEEWESVRAFLETSLDRVQQVDPGTLARINPELRNQVETKFIPGLLSGIAGLRTFAQANTKMARVNREGMTDSLTRGRSLLANWNAWYDHFRSQILAELPSQPSD